jgi:hypothetical protein
LLKLLQQPWSNLRGISNSYAAKSTVLIPLIGYMILFNEHLVHLFDLARELEGGQASGRISPRLFWLYFGFCAIAVASLVYAKWCPVELKVYKTAEAFTNGVRQHTPLKGYTEFERTLQNTEYKPEIERLTKGDFTPDYQIAITHIYFKYLNKSHAWARAFCTGFYAIGFFCLGIPALDAFARILILLLKTLNPWA